MLIEIYKLLNPVVSIIDAVVAMEGMGPLSGSPRKLGCLVASADPIACELICASLIGIGPDQLPIVNTAKKLRFGCSNYGSIQLLGDDLSVVAQRGIERADRSGVGTFLRAVHL